MSNVAIPLFVLAFNAALGKLRTKGADIGGRTNIDEWLPSSGHP